MSGLQVQTRSYAAAVANEVEQQDQTEETTPSLENQVLEFFKKEIAVDVSQEDIEVVHFLRRKNSASKDIVVRFCSRRKKAEVMRKKKVLKGKKVYLNEHLTHKNAMVFKRARELRAQRKITSTWTRDGKVFIKTLGEQEKVILISSQQDFQKYGLV